MDASLRRRQGKEENSELAQFTSKTDRESKKVIEFIWKITKSLILLAQFEFPESL